MAKKNKRPTFSSAGAAPMRTEFTPDYSNVKKDLSRIGLLAGLLFAGLIALSFFIK
jgi:hypothetical protein